MVSDNEILDAQHIMASEAGVFGEPASAASLAGLIKLTGQGEKYSDKVIVCVVTGTGLKDTETALKKAPPIPELPADIKAVEKALGWG
jgi:threonine synthase